ncbi:hypothetical protein ACSLBF_14445 [Pseudoalteromonas sp. T1lg65]|uniref:hypothetical protein n=1 Tax=Pseudoalteromonas sp. T1lg65 TaxID=2077101 RepID=UPI003F79F857
MVWALIKNSLVAGLLGAVVFSARGNELDIYIRDDVLTEYQRFLQGRSVLEVNDFGGAYTRRDVIDMVLAMQALRLGGFTTAIHFRPGNVSFRESSIIASGKQLLSFDSYWLSELQGQLHFFISDPVVEKGDYIAGIYYSPQNTKVANIRSLEDFSSLTAVSNRKWRADWTVLTKLSLQQLHDEYSWTAQARMVSQGWVDFMLAPLMPSQNNQFKLEDINLVAHNRLAVLINDSRHFAISRLHIDGERAFAAMQKGLSIMRLQGKLKLAYQQAGFIPSEQAYKIINPATEIQRNSPK